jgi:hypothetical protein
MQYLKANGNLQTKDLENLKKKKKDKLRMRYNDHWQEASKETKIENLSKIKKYFPL